MVCGKVDSAFEVDFLAVKNHSAQPSGIHRGWPCLRRVIVKAVGESEASLLSEFWLWARVSGIFEIDSARAIDPDFVGGLVEVNFLADEGKVGCFDIAKRFIG